MAEVGVKEIYPEEINLRLSGRTLLRDKSLYLLHSASFLEFEFEGRLIEADFESEGGGEDFKAWIGIFIDDMEHAYKRISLQSGTIRYQLWESGKTEKKRVRIVKMSESQYAYTALKKIIFDDDAKAAGTVENKKRIEFIGDSITCGFGNEGKAEDEFTTGTENPLLAYGVLTAKKLDCDFTLTAWSGIGIISSWIPPEVEEPNTEVLMPVVYPYVDYGLYARKGWEPKELYDYSKDNCDVIVVNLGTNDSSYTRDNPKRIQAFQSEYEKFLKYLLQTHRNKPIICTSGALTELLNNEIENAVETVRKTGQNLPVYHMRFTPQDEEDGEGAVGHPSILRHEKMAKQLSDWIKKNRILE